MKRLIIISLCILFLLAFTQCNKDVEVVYIKPDSGKVTTRYIYETPPDTIKQSEPDTTVVPAFLVKVDTLVKIDIRVDIEKLDDAYEKNGKTYPYKITGGIWKVKTAIETYSDSTTISYVFKEKLLYEKHSYAACSGSARRAKDAMESQLRITNYKIRWFQDTEHRLQD